MQLSQLVSKLVFGTLWKRFRRKFNLTECSHLRGQPNGVTKNGQDSLKLSKEARVLDIRTDNDDLRYLILLYYFYIQPI